MEGTYDVMLGSQKMGQVTVRKQGLYWQFDCQCDLCGEVMYDLVVMVADSWVKLGVLTPGNGCFCLCTKLAMKRLGQGSPVFNLQPRHGEMKRCFVKVSPTEPFSYISKLEDSYLAKKDGQIGIELFK